MNPGEMPLWLELTSLACGIAGVGIGIYAFYDLRKPVQEIRYRGCVEERIAKDYLGRIDNIKHIL